MYATSNDEFTPLPIGLRNPYRHPVPSNNSPRGEQFAHLIRTARISMGMSQDTLAEHSGLNRSTVIRWESGEASRPDPDQVRRVCVVLGIDPRRAAVALGFLTQEEINVVGGPNLAPELAEVLDLLQDPSVSSEDKERWIEYLRYLRAKNKQNMDEQAS